MESPEEGKVSRAPLSNHLEVVTSEVSGGTYVMVRTVGAARPMISAVMRTAELHALSPTDMVFVGTMLASAGLEILHAGGAPEAVVSATVDAGKRAGGAIAAEAVKAARKEDA